MDFVSIWLLELSGTADEMAVEEAYRVLNSSEQKTTLVRNLLSIYDQEMTSLSNKNA